MEFPENIDSLLKVDQEGFIIASGKNYMQKLKPNRQKQALKLFAEIINIFGSRSAKSQNLKQIITSLDRFSGTDQRIYIKVSENKVLGFVKVGQKNLFYRDYVTVTQFSLELSNSLIQHAFLIYMCISLANALAQVIFEKFLAVEDKNPQKLAYDKPSDKLIGFLKKHYNLSKFIPQNNNFVIFDRYFEKNSQKPKSSLINSRKEKPQEYQDSIQVLKKEINNSKTIQQQKKIILTKKQDLVQINPNKIISNYPWALGTLSDKRAFRTTSGTYGSHYNYYK